MGRVEPDAVTARRQELASFLRARRASLQPGDVSLPVRPGRRNTPGLRREEVAQLSGVGLTWYTWLEQARPINVTSQVVDALGHAFRLDHQTHAHMRRLAGLPAPEPDQMPDTAGPETARLLDVVAPAPACILGPCLDFLAWNETFEKLWHPDALPPGRCNLMWLVFCDPAFRHTIVAWRARARTLMREFRAAHGQRAGDTRFAELVAELTESSAEFRQWWPDYDVVESITGNITVRHAVAGTIRLRVNELRLSAYPSLTLSVQVPQRDVDRVRLDTLAGRASPVPSVPRPTGARPGRTAGHRPEKKSA